MKIKRFTENCGSATKFTIFRLLKNFPDSTGTEIIITKNGPQCKGRVERYNGIAQDRLLHELQYYGIDNVEEANKFIKEVFISEYNKQFGVKPALEGDVYIRLNEDQINNLKWLFCKRYERSLSYDYIIQYMNEYYQIMKSNEYIIFPKKKLVIGKTIEGEIGIFDGWYKLKQVNYTKLDAWNVRMKRAEIFGPKNKERIENDKVRKEANRLKREEHLKESKERKHHYQAERLLEKKIKFDQGLFDGMGEIGD